MLIAWEVAIQRSSVRYDHGHVDGQQERNFQKPRPHREMPLAETNFYDCQFNNKLMGIPSNKNTFAKFLQTQCRTYEKRRMLGTREFLRDGRRGAYEWYSYGDFYKLTVLLAKGLEEMGLFKGDKVGIISANRVEWTALDFACASLGVVVVPIYDTQSLDDIRYVCNDAGVKMCFCALDKLDRIKHIAN